MNDRNRRQDQSENRKLPPQTETKAETYYYKKQMDARTKMVFVLQDNEEIEGIIDWYDLGSLKIDQANGPKILLLKHNIKYLYKSEDRD